SQGEQGEGALQIDIASWFEPMRILGYTALIGAVNVVLITAPATLRAVLYNVSSDLVGGVEVTFSEAAYTCPRGPAPSPGRREQRAGGGKLSSARTGRFASARRMRYGSSVAGL